MSKNGTGSFKESLTCGGVVSSKNSCYDSDKKGLGAYKLSCNCDGVDVDVFEDSDMSEERIMEEQEHVEVPFNIFDRNPEPGTAETLRREQNRQLLLGRIRAARGRDEEQRLLEDREKANQRRVPVCRFRIPDTSQASYPHGQQAHPTFPNMSLQDPIESRTHEHWIDSEEHEYPIFGRPVFPNDEAVVCTTTESHDRNPENQAAEELEASHAIYEDIFRTTSETSSTDSQASVGPMRCGVWRRNCPSVATTCASKWLKINRSCPHCRRKMLDPEEFPNLSQ
ncbi:hypothetical protein B9Z55_028185 [Caenorhabditis nigoni]|nr:hypothetical protein B9Z55_028185 [Caenorhabditis nigoni]